MSRSVLILQNSSSYRALTIQPRGRNFMTTTVPCPTCTWPLSCFFIGTTASKVSELTASSRDYTSFPVDRRSQPGKTHIGLGIPENRPEGSSWVCLGTKASGKPSFGSTDRSGSERLIASDTEWFQASLRDYVDFNDVPTNNSEDNFCSTKDAAVWRQKVKHAYWKGTAASRKRVRDNRVINKDRQKRISAKLQQDSSTMFFLFPLFNFLSFDRDRHDDTVWAYRMKRSTDRAESSSTKCDEKEKTNGGSASMFPPKINIDQVTVWPKLKGYMGIENIKWVSACIHSMAHRSVRSWI